LPIHLEKASLEVCDRAIIFWIQWRSHAYIPEPIFGSTLHTHLPLFNRPLPAFQVCGYSGFIAGAVQSFILIKALGLSYLVLLGMTGVLILTFYRLVMATKVITGEEQIIYYHHEIAVMAMIALFLRLTHQMLLPYLDIGILGIGLFLAFGRVGCLTVGCCHGRPYKFGVCYKPEHAKEGFPASLVGVRLFPIQAIESLFVLCVVVLGDVFVARGQQPGEALELYLTSAPGTFCLTPGTRRKSLLLSSTSSISRAFRRWHTFVLLPWACRFPET
jgi:hypothetical protein